MQIGIDSIFESTGIKPIKLPPFSPNLNCYAENFVGKIKSESLDHIIFVGSSEGEIKCKERLGALLKYYYRKAA